eukprot:COSAG06_NODE_4511_length_4192_cov_3.194723_2_plen_118_part_00
MCCGWIHEIASNLFHLPWMLIIRLCGGVAEEEEEEEVQQRRQHAVPLPLLPCSSISGAVEKARLTERNDCAHSPTHTHSHTQTGAPNVSRKSADWLGFYLARLFARLLVCSAACGAH